MATENVFVTFSIYPLYTVTWYHDNYMYILVMFL